MPLFGLVWVTSWVSYFIASSQGLLKVPDYLTSTFPTKVFSVVSSPLEIPSALVFPTPLTSRIGSSNSSIAAVPNLAFQSSTAPFQFQTQSGQTSATRPLLQQDIVKNAFCRPELEPKKDPLPVMPVSQSQSVLEDKSSARNGSKSTLPQQILQVMQNLLPWRQRVESVKTLASSIEVISTQSWETVGDQQNPDKKFVKRGFWQYSQRLTNRVIAGASSKNKDKEQFQVWMNGRLIAQLRSQQQAELMAERLKQFLSHPSAPDLNASLIEPALVEGLPTVKVGNHLLFKVDNALAKDLDRNAELLAIEWTNNLRSALGKAPLKLAEAQKRLYKLVETPKTFTGQASWYGANFHGRATATGEIYNQHELTAAHPSLPFDTYLKVRNLRNGASVIVRINDRGPYVPDRTIDLSREAARCINGEKAGIMRIEAVIMRSPSAHSGQYLVRN